MRSADHCPECGRPVGRVETELRDGTRVLVYWHTDLEDHKEFCLEWPSGETDAIETRVPTADLSY